MLNYIDHSVCSCVLQISKGWVWLVSGVCEAESRPSGCTFCSYSGCCVSDLSQDKVCWWNWSQMSLLWRAIMCTMWRQNCITLK